MLDKAQKGLYNNCDSPKWAIFQIGIKKHRSLAWERYGEDNEVKPFQKEKNSVEEVETENDVK